MGFVLAMFLHLDAVMHPEWEQVHDIPAQPVCSLLSILSRGGHIYSPTVQGKQKLKTLLVNVKKS